MDLKFDYKKNY